MNFAIVFGTSEQGISLSKQMLISCYKNVYNGKNQIDAYSYICNYRVTDVKSLSAFFNKKQKEPSGFTYDAPSTEHLTLFDDMQSFWPGNIYVKNTTNNFDHFYLPDVAVYHDFASKYAPDYDLVLYCHNDIIFTCSGVLDKWINILSYESKYSIITELRAVANKDISVRFHCCFILTNTKKFEESGLSFINNLKLIDEDKYYSYANGGGGLLASFYDKKNNTKWQPYLLDTHGTYRDIDIKSEDKWFNHLAAIEWNRKMSLSEGGNPARSAEAYKQAELFIRGFLEPLDNS